MIGNKFLSDPFSENPYNHSYGYYMTDIAKYNTKKYNDPEPKKFSNNNRPLINDAFEKPWETDFIPEDNIELPKERKTPEGEIRNPFYTEGFGSFPNNNQIYLFMIFILAIFLVFYINKANKLEMIIFLLNQKKLDNA